MEIRYKVITEFCGQKSLKNNTVWLCPDKIVSISEKYNSKLAMLYIRIVDCNNKHYDVYEQYYINLLLELQEKKTKPYKKLKENLGGLASVGLLGLMFVAGGIGLGIEYSSQIQQLDKNAPISQAK